MVYPKIYNRSDIQGCLAYSYFLLEATLFRMLFFRALTEMPEKFRLIFRTDFFTNYSSGNLIVHGRLIRLVDNSQRNNSFPDITIDLATKNPFLSTNIFAAWLWLFNLVLKINFHWRLRTFFSHLLHFGPRARKNTSCKSTLQMC